MKDAEIIKVLTIPKNFKGVIDGRKKKQPTIQFYEWVMKQMGKPIGENGLEKVHVSEVMLTPATGDALYKIQKKAVRKELGDRYTDKKIQTETAFFWLAYGPSEAMTEGEEFKVYLTKDWYK